MVGAKEENKTAQLLKTDLKQVFPNHRFSKPLKT
jgi:hypothetical protein